MDAFATAISIALQYGVPLPTLVDKFSHTRFEPSGFTKNPEIPIAKSIMDYIFRWLASKFLSREEKTAAGVILQGEAPAALGNGHRPEAVAGEVEKPAAVDAAAAETGPPGVEQAKVAFLYQQDAPSCHECGSIMVRNGSCYKCLNCGSTSGCS
jgi:ribonucleoside-diphosphate reductase alpha chain